MQESLFSMEAEEFDGPAVEGKTKITRSETLKVETIDNAEKLFDGFKTMKAITWSYGVSMVAKQMRKFEDIELVFGCKAILEKQIKLTALAPLVVQAETFEAPSEQIGKRDFRQGRERGSAGRISRTLFLPIRRFTFFANPETEKYRVITGSANFSNKAWNGNKQKEVILVCDDRDSYFEVLEKVYEPFKATCATRVDSLKASLDELDRSGTGWVW